MVSRIAGLSTVFLSLVVVACQQRPERGLPCAVQAALRRDCQSCHSDPPRYGALLPLVTFADLHAPAPGHPAQRVYERVWARIHDVDAPMPPSGALAKDVAALDAWISAGAPPAPPDLECPPGAQLEPPKPEPTCGPALDTQRILPNAPVPIPTDADSLLCYGVDVPVAAKRHVVSLIPHIDDVELVHHVTLFVADTPVDPTPKPCPENGGPGFRLMSTWVPGAQPLLELPPEAGFPEEGTMHYAVQLHYRNLAHRPGRRDESGFSLCTTEILRPHDAGVLVFGTTDFTVQPHGSLDLACAFAVPPELAGRTLFGALPHMHQMGQQMATSLTPFGGGNANDLGSSAPFLTDNQHWIPIHAIAHEGDLVETRCVWDNPGGSPVVFGEGPNDEMCWSFTMYYPSVEAPGWTWDLPSQKAQCQAVP